ncbi:hypothetical protein Mapa_017030 [Marchantia paleacea]|nr:hypothetical protein Mapa_017030 [Marchantia paleacea]
MYVVQVKSGEEGYYRVLRPKNVADFSPLFVLHTRPPSNFSASRVSRTSKMCLLDHLFRLGVIERITGCAFSLSAGFNLNLVTRVANAVSSRCTGQGIFCDEKSCNSVAHPTIAIQRH